MNFPNFLSALRIFLLFPIIFFFEKNFFSLSLLFFVIGSITDYLDGYIARKFLQSSELGALLDLLADKIFVSILLIWMTFSLENNLILVSSILIICREIVISYLRLYLVSRSKNLEEVKVDIFGKFKTFLQMTALGLIIISPNFSNLFLSISTVILFISAIFSWASFIKYSRKWYES